MEAKRRELTDDVKYENGEISLREFIMAIMQADITRIDSIAEVNARRLEDITDAEVRRLEEVIKAQVEKLDLNTDAIKEAMITQQEMNKERLDSHNKFREQIEMERRDLVRKDDLARVEREMAMRFEAAQEKIDLALIAQNKALDTINDALAITSGKWTALAIFVPIALTLATAGLAALILLVG